jgi:acyl-CoA synthetase (AMP-forming)/AMP-acid ligase II
VATAPDARALIEAATGEIHSRRALDARATALANTLRGGARTPSALFAPVRQSTFSVPADSSSLSGCQIVFSRPNGPEWLAVFLACLQLGAVPVPLDPSEPADSQRSLATSAHAHFLLTPDNQLHPIFVQSLTAQPSTLNSTPRERAALIKLTSGSTGTPRALAFTHAQMLADGHQVCTSMDIQPGDLNLGLIPFGHSYGLGNLVIPLLAQGTAIVCVSAPLHHAIAADCARWQPTVFPAVPAILRILALTDVPADSLQSLRVIISAGSALPPETARAFLEKFGKRIHGFYGSSETGGIAYDRTGDATLTGRSAGTPLDGVTLNFTRARRFTVSSPAVFTQSNRHRAPSGNGAHAPADLAALNAHGELVLLGRTGRMVKIASRRLDLTALELEIKKLPGLRDAYAAPHPNRPDELACALATDLCAAYTRALLHRSLAAWKIPKRLLVLKEFPLTPRGKTDTKALRAALSSESRTM